MSPDYAVSMGCASSTSFDPPINSLHSPCLVNLISTHAGPLQLKGMNKFLLLLCVYHILCTILNKNCRTNSNFYILNSYTVLKFLEYKLHTAATLPKQINGFKWNFLQKKCRKSGMEWRKTGWNFIMQY